ncbi:MAG: FecR domain-containing protein, partial [Anaerolineae bacterium]|nr:FecR domain-containing protein [Anaerolineae bacterium]
MMQRWAKRNPERAAWVVLWTAFAIFVCLAVSVPLSIRWYLHNATQPQNAYLEKIDGMLTVQERRGQEPIAVNSGREVKEGFLVVTGADSRATLTFFENSTALLYGNSRLAVGRLRRPRFSLSQRPDEVTVTLEQGLVRFRVAGSGERAREVRVQTPLGQIHLNAGG